MAKLCHACDRVVPCLWQNYAMLVANSSIGKKNPGKYRAFNYCITYLSD